MTQIHPDGMGSSLGPPCAPPNRCRLPGKAWGNATTCRNIICVICVICGFSIKAIRAPGCPGRDRFGPFAALRVTLRVGAPVLLPWRLRTPSRHHPHFTSVKNPPRLGFSRGPRRCHPEAAPAAEGADAAGRFRPLRCAQGDITRGGAVSLPWHLRTPSRHHPHFTSVKNPPRLGFSRGAARPVLVLNGPTSAGTAFEKQLVAPRSARTDTA